MDLVIRPASPKRARPKRNEDAGSARKSNGASSSASLKKQVAGNADANGDVTGLRDTITRVIQERDLASARLQRAEEDLDAAQQRLEDADSARRHLLVNVAAGGDEARRRFASALPAEPPPTMMKSFRDVLMAPPVTWFQPHRAPSDNSAARPDCTEATARNASLR